MFLITEYQFISINRMLFGSYAFTFVAVKIMEYLQTMPPVAPHPVYSHQPEVNMAEIVQPTAACSSRPGLQSARVKLHPH